MTQVFSRISSGRRLPVSNSSIVMAPLPTFTIFINPGLGPENRPMITPKVVPGPGFLAPRISTGSPPTLRLLLARSSLRLLLYVFDYNGKGGIAYA